MSDPAHVPLARKEGLIVQELPDELLIYDLNRHDAYCLNRSAALVWKHCDGRKNVRQIARLLGAELPARVAEDLVWLTLDRLFKARLVVGRSVPSDRRTRVSRREVAQKLGMASLLALPVITSIVAPAAAQARSCVGPQIPVAFCSAKTKGRCCVNNKVCNGAKCV